MTTDPAIFLACDVAVRAALRSSAVSIRNHRPRAQRGRYRHVAAEQLYRALTPPPSSAEVADLPDGRWDILRAVLAFAGHDHQAITAIIARCATYEHDLLTEQDVHDPDRLAKRLTDVAAA